MWSIAALEVRPIAHDFRAAGMGPYRDRAVHAGEVCLINALALVDFTVDPVQLLLCTCCGTPGCATDGWARLRRTGDRLLLLEPAPATDDEIHQAPPAYLSQRGVAAIHREAWEKLCQLSACTPPWSALPELEAIEAAPHPG